MHIPKTTTDFDIFFAFHSVSYFDNFPTSLDSLRSSSISATRTRPRTDARAHARTPRLRRIPIYIYGGPSRRRTTTATDTPYAYLNRYIFKRSKRQENFRQYLIPVYVSAPVRTAPTFSLSFIIPLPHICIVYCISPFPVHMLRSYHHRRCARARALGVKIFPTL